MAKTREPKEGEFPTTPEGVLALEERMDKLLTKAATWTAQQEVLAVTLQGLLDTSSEQTDWYNREMDQLAEIATKKDKILVGLAASHKKADVTGKLDIEEKIKREQNLLEHYRIRADALQAAHLQLKAIHKEDKAGETSLDKLRETNEAKRSKRVGKILKKTKATAADIEDFAIKSAKAASRGFIETLETAGPALTALAIFKPELGPMRVLKQLEEEMLRYDDSFRSVVKNTGLYGGALRDIFAGAFDPGILEVGAKGMQDIGLTSADVAATMQGLISTTSVFREEMAKTFADEKGNIFGTNLAKRMVNTVAGLKKLGVAEADSAKAIDQFTKALGQTPAIATDSTTKLLTLAQSLNMNAGQAMKDFTALMPDLAAYGGQAIDVLAKMEAQARATGVEIGSLNSFAKKMDTFKGAAEVAQRFNAQLGGMHLSAIDLAQADLPDKIAMIQDAMARAGKSWDDMGRRGRQALTAALGIESVETAARILNAKEEFEEAAGAIDTVGMSQKQLRAKIRETMTQLELQTASISRHGAGFDAWTKRTRKVAIQGANATTAGFIRTRQEVGGAEQAAVGMLAAYKGLEGTLGRLAGPLAAVTRATKGMAKNLGIVLGAGTIVGAGVYAAGSPKEKRQMDKIYKKKADDMEKQLKDYAEKRGLYEEARKASPGEYTPQASPSGRKGLSEDLIHKYSSTLLKSIESASKDSGTDVEREKRLAHHIIAKLDDEGFFARGGNITKIINTIDGVAVGDLLFEEIGRKLENAVRAY